MKKKSIIVAISIILLGMSLFAIYYFFYLKKVVIYDQVNIEFYGISPDKTSEIKIFGVTPLNKKIIINRNNPTNIKGVAGYYQFIEIIIPDTLISKITSIRTSIKEKTYIFKISDMYSTASSNNAHTYILPPEVKSEGIFLNKLSLAYPFNKVLPVLKIVLLVVLYITGILLIIFCIGYLWKLITQNTQKRFIQKFSNFLQEKKQQYLLLFIIFILLIAWPILWSNQIYVKYFLVILLYISFVIQSLLFIRKSYVLFLFRALIIILLCFEIIFGVLNKIDRSNIAIIVNNIQMEDPELGWKNIPNCHEKSFYKTIGSDTVYSAYASTDEFGRRVPKENTDVAEENGKKKKHAIFLGDSYTFGQGLNYCSSFPFLFECIHPDFKPYNYGTMGYGPHQLCLLFDEGINTINNYTVPEDSGLCVYTYIYDHMNRVYGGSKYLSWAINSHAVYVNNNRLIYEKQSNFRKYISWFLNNSETMKYFRLTNSYPESEEFYKRFADLINYMALKYGKIKPRGEFYVGLYPGNAYDTSWIKFLDRNITVLNIPPPIDYETNFSSYIIKGDVHPTKKLNSYYVKEISKLIFKNE